MAQLTYGPVALPFCINNHFMQEAVYDPSFTDFYLMRFSISVQAVVNPDYYATLAAPLGAANQKPNPADIMKVVRSWLFTPRQTLSFLVNDVELMPTKQTGTAGPVDAENGPRPQFCHITNLTDGTFLVSFGIVASYWENYSRGVAAGNPPFKYDNRKGNPVLTNRWAETITIDNCQYSQRLRMGKLMIRSDNAQVVSPDSLRATMAVTGLPPGWIRTSSKYTVDPNGLGLSYVITDNEVYLVPPDPAYEANGIYSETTTQLGALRHGRVTVTLRGGKTTDASRLMRTAVQVALGKLIAQGQGVGLLGIDLNAALDLKRKGAELFFLQDAQVSHQMWDNQVNVEIATIMNPTLSKTSQTMGVYVPRFLKPPKGSEPGTPSPTYVPYGTAEYLLRAANYYDPSFPDTVLNQALNQLTQGVLPGEAGPGEGGKF